MRRSRSSLAAAALALLLPAGCGERAGCLEWPVMGTVAAVQTRAADAADSAMRVRGPVQARFAALEAALNAHDPASDLSRLAPLADAEVCARCAPEVRPCYAAAFRLQALSGGAFSPRWRGAGTLDLGAIAKGFAVDCAAADAAGAASDASVLLDLGGNVKSLRGTWRTGVKDPSGAGIAAVVALRPGEALATSATYFRGSHIRDGRTGCVVSNGVASVTVLSPSAMWADGLSTTLFVLGPEEGRAFLDRHGDALAAARPLAVLWLLEGGRRVACDPDGRFGGPADARNR